MEKNLIALSYDKESDVLYMRFGTPRFGIDEETEDGILSEEMKPVIRSSV